MGGETRCRPHLPGTRGGDGKELLAKQKRYFADMRSEIKKGIDDKSRWKRLPTGWRWRGNKEWTGKAAEGREENVKHVYDELSGKIDHDRLGMRSAPLDYFGPETAGAHRALPTVLRPPGTE